MNGYRKAIRDRMPENWVFVLKYLGKLGAWIELVYGTRIRPINKHWNHKQKKGLKKRALRDLFANSFYYTLDSNRMTSDEYESWYKAWRWIAWTSAHYLFVCDIYDKLQIHDGLSHNQAIAKLCYIFGIDAKFANALIIRHCKEIYEKRP